MPNYERDAQIERALGAMQNALQSIANYGDCDHYDESTKPMPCSCPHCTARRALETDATWRCKGARFERTTTMHREAAIMVAWKKYVFGASVGDADYRLAQILDQARDHGPSNGAGEYERPTARDWYVASSLIQWLVTNVGSSLLDAAGYVYKPER